MEYLKDGRSIGHLAFVMDGNRRWAKKSDKAISKGHEAGLVAMERILSPLFERGIPFISVYAFSVANWSRSPQEIEDLHKLIRRFRDKNINDYKDRGIRVVVSGSKEQLSPDILEIIESLQEETKDLQKSTLNICFNYGGRDELVRAARSFAQDVLAGREQVEKLTEDSFKQYLFVPHIPDVDLFIRTSGEKRMSDFLLYQSAYAELFFTPTLWPDLTLQEVEEMMQEFLGRQRRFGS